MARLVPCIGVANLPDNTPVEVNAVLVRDPATKKSVNSVAGTYIGTGNRPWPVPDAVLTADRAYISDCRGNGANDISAEVKAALDHMGAVLKAAGLDHRHMVFVNPYMLDSVGYDVMGHVYAQYFEFGNTPARATINVAALPQWRPH